MYTHVLTFGVCAAGGEKIDRSPTSWVGDVDRSICRRRTKAISIQTVRHKKVYILNLSESDQGSFFYVLGVLYHTNSPYAVFHVI